MKLKLTKKKIIILIVIAIALTIIGVFAYRKMFTKKIVATYKEHTVSRGNITNVIEASGTIQPLDQYDVVALVKGEILADPFEEGQEVKEGDLLYKIDSKDAENSILQSQLNLEKAEINYEQSRETLENLNVKSLKGGYVTRLYVEEGDDIQNGTKIADICDNRSLTLTIPFNSGDADSINIGDTANVVVSATFENLLGKVEKIYASETVLDGFMTVRNVDIVVDNPGALMPGSRATAIVNGIACNSEGSFEYYAQETITSKVSGKVAKILKNEGDFVSKNNYVVRLESDTTETQVKSNQLSVRSAQANLQNTQEQLENYNITSPINGTVIQKNIKKGEKIDSGNNSSIMAVIADMSKVTFDISVDELDIGNIKLNQDVIVTADSLPGKIFNGRITYISVLGSSSNGVATYPVTVTIDEYTDLMPGMNVNATIVVSASENVITVPVSAVNRGNTVYVKDNSAPSDQEEGDNKKKSFVPKGYKAVKVETGISDQQNIEIKSGLNEGDIIGVAVQTITPNTATQVNSNMGMPAGRMMMGSGMPAGIPSGRMPNGGMSGGNRQQGGNSGNRQR